MKDFIKQMVEEERRMRQPEQDIIEYLLEEDEDEDEDIEEELRRIRG